MFALECTAPAFIVYLAPTESGSVRLMGVHDGPVTTRVRGGASDYAALATSEDPTATLINSPLELSGDSGPLIQLQQTLGQLDLDWEAPLVEALGDVAGHQLAEVLRAGFSWRRPGSAHRDLSSKTSTGTYRIWDCRWIAWHHVSRDSVAAWIRWAEDRVATGEAWPDYSRCGKVSTR